MRPVFKIIDEDTGDIMHEGFVTSWQWSFSSYNGKKFNFEGVEMPKGAAVPPSGIYNASIPILKTATKCDHSWKTYQGFMDQYEYCDKCNEKKT